MKIHYYKKDILKICNKGHLTALEIFKKISKIYPNISKSSIYRNIIDLVEKGKLRKLEGVGKKAYFEKNIGEHIHLIDKNTGNIVDLEKLNIKISNIPKNFKVNSLDIKIFGEFNSK